MGFVHISDIKCAQCGRSFIFGSDVTGATFGTERRKLWDVWMKYQWGQWPDDYIDPLVIYPPYYCTGCSCDYERDQFTLREEQEREQQQMQERMAGLSHPAPIVVNGKYANCGTLTDAVFSCTSNDGLNIGGATVTNNSLWLSGNLKAQLYYCLKDKNDTRYLMKEAEIGILNPNIEKSFSFPDSILSDPPTDCYYATVVVSELTASGIYVIVSEELFLNEIGYAETSNTWGKRKIFWQHSTNEHEPHPLVKLSNGKLGTSGRISAINFVNPKATITDKNKKERRITVSVGRIENWSDWDTGNLVLELWLLDYTYTGNLFNGYKIATWECNPLKQGQCFSNFFATIDFTLAIDSTNLYPHLLCKEYTSNGGCAWGKNYTVMESYYWVSLEKAKVKDFRLYTSSFLINPSPIPNYDFRNTAKPSPASNPSATQSAPPSPPPAQNPPPKQNTPPAQNPVAEAPKVEEKLTRCWINVDLGNFEWTFKKPYLVSRHNTVKMWMTNVTNKSNQTSGIFCLTLTYSDGDKQYIMGQAQNNVGLKGGYKYEKFELTSPMLANPETGDYTAKVFLHELGTDNKWYWAVESGWKDKKHWDHLPELPEGVTNDPEHDVLDLDHADGGVAATLAATTYDHYTYKNQDIYAMKGDLKCKVCEKQISNGYGFYIPGIPKKYVCSLECAKKYID